MNYDRASAPQLNPIKGQTIVQVSIAVSASFSKHTRTTEIILAVHHLNSTVRPGTCDERVHESVPFISLLYETRDKFSLLSVLCSLQKVTLCDYSLTRLWQKYNKQRTSFFSIKKILKSNKNSY